MGPLSLGQIGRENAAKGTAFPRLLFPLRYGVLEVDFERLCVSVGGRPVPLEGVLLKILIVLARHPRHVLTRARLLADVWGADSGRQTKTVDVAICRLKGRLGSAADYISSVRSFGYQFGPPGDSDQPPRRRRHGAGLAGG